MVVRSFDQLFGTTGCDVVYSEVVVWNKRGNTGGGASSGSAGTKRGGKDYTSSRTVDRGTMTCLRCNGRGTVASR